MRHFGSNVGLRASALPLEIDCPEGASDSPADRRIRLGDLMVRHDPELGLLVLHARGRTDEIRPVHPGLVAELWLPPALRLLMQSLGATSNLLIPGRRMFGDPSLDEVGEVLAQPRVVVGSTTVSRRQWVLPPGSVPTRAKGESDQRLLLRLADWLAGHGMPQRCFVRALDPRSVVSGEVWRVKSRKPVYVDFANLLLIGVLERLLAAGPEQVVFLQEALPDSRPATGPRRRRAPGDRIPRRDQRRTDRMTMTDGPDTAAVLDPAAARAEDWVCAHVFYDADQDALLTRCVRPLVADLERRGLAQSHFFLRYWEGGPHVRLRVLPRSLAHSDGVRAAMEHGIGAFLAESPSPDVVDRSRFAGVARGLAGLEGREGHDDVVRPNNSVEFTPYVREHADYGHGAAIAAVERHFCESSFYWRCRW